MNWLLLSLGVIFATVLGIVALALGITAGWVLFVLAALLAAALVVDVALARRGRRTAAAGEGEPDVPNGYVEVPDGRPLGDSADLHGEISPIDLPRGNPGRRQAELEAARGSGTTPGNR